MNRNERKSYWAAKYISNTGSHALTSNKGYDTFAGDLYYQDGIQMKNEIQLESKEQPNPENKFPGDLC